MSSFLLNWHKLKLSGDRPKTKENLGGAYVKKNIYVLYGGKSVEHEVSFKTASYVMNAMDKDKYNIYPVYITMEGVWCPLDKIEGEIKAVEELKAYSTSSIAASMGEFLTRTLKPQGENVVFPALHGANGEDGTIQGLLELLDIPYVGNGVLGSAVGLDKVVCKDLFTKAGIPQVKYRAMWLTDYSSNGEGEIQKLEADIGYPCYVKPASLGSSVGISRCSNREELEQAIKEAFRYDRKLVIEAEAIGREMQIAVVGNDYPKASVVGEFIQERSFMDYNAKYLDGKLVAVIPAKITDEMSSRMRSTAEEAARVLNCVGLVRVDFFVTEDKYFVNEVNTMPGFTKLSMFPALWEKTDGTTNTQLMDIFIELAIERHKQKKALLDRRKA